MPSSGNSSFSGWLIATSRLSISMILFSSRSAIGGLPGGFADHVAGVFVAPQSKEARMAELAVVGPFGEAEFAHEMRLDPGNVLAAGSIGKWAFVDRMRLEPVPEFDEKVIVVAGTYFSGVAQALAVTAVTLVLTIVANEECAKSLSLAFRLGKAGNNQFLAVFALELQPVA